MHSETAQAATATEAPAKDKVPMYLVVVRDRDDGKVKRFTATDIRDLRVKLKDVDPADILVCWKGREVTLKTETKLVL